MGILLGHFSGILVSEWYLSIGVYGHCYSPA